MYSPTLGRWVQQDPTGYGDGMSSYAFEESSQLFHLDPTGEKRIVLLQSGQDFIFGGKSLEKYAEILDPDPDNIVLRMEEDSDLFRRAAWRIHQEQLKQFKNKCPLHTIVLVGHSNGGDGARKVAAQLAELVRPDKRRGYTVDLLVLLDPIGKPVHRWEEVKDVSGNVKRAVDYFQRQATFSFSLPFLGTFKLWGYQIAGENHQIHNIDDGDNPKWGPHVNLPYDPRVFGPVLGRIRAVPTEGEPTQ